MQARCKLARCLERCLWESLNAALLDCLVEHGLVCAYEPKDYLFRERERSRGLYVLCHGLVKLIKTASNEKHVIVTLIHPGQLVGGAFFFNDGLFPVSAQAVEASGVLFLHKNYVNYLLQRDAEFSYTLLATSNRQLSLTLNALSDFAALDVEQRLAGALLEFAETAATHTQSSAQNGLVCRLPLRRSELADYIGTTPETTMRTLSKLKRQKIIALQRRMITYLDLPRLRALSVTK